ncbi:23S rRNA (uracil-C(5))-methyltransferase RlmCD,23S rRNA methyluridine methyltransferase,Predicted O-methyltransferase,23S rRNA (uracil-5-)-methyltransferase RumA,tRNA (Uracil-5-)-methyltransferase [Chlamydia serpentis]|uniref:23S rRNA (Uracil-C(5))-methyltransferase RlmCD,23S rRNA methyluridine methyltransferase,Predicted O-methyltransferase,23S rRNA (Uracil-5-)-methyltransferase RumA,tRNA (Uracil-5-)-methyltransferase n=1 Tax=Chlamydia serpentis TaxID=1967782 RepID=A0A2R8FC32_9CHLA|nr:23S rRNA (uracil(1939)-C(5))-methyltransferase RlmD [Chlamydia serpentis]SPN73995.1 23S rRNA (uracil-C(5))-methyltransferase RlmCD,23S rRNA methyluridine methyltransferase,Predicted O-methyltransferase,23S rRNA (uracil-5-)-methyltransferase RumA,tRNA (Uracil-5-)-methyltransferase [Chlamydia serpentis]
MSTMQNCPHFGLCGGCSSPQSEYIESLKRKEELLHDLFASLVSTDIIAPIIPCFPPLRGRNKMEFSFFQTPTGEKSLGFISSTKPKKGIPVTTCLLIHEHTMDILKLTRQWWDQHPELIAYFAPKNKGSLCTLAVRIGSPEHKFMVILTTSGAPEYRVEETIINEWKDILLSSSLNISSIYWEEKIANRGISTYYKTRLLYGEPCIHQQLSLTIDDNSAGFSLRPRSFFQPQSVQAVKIIETAKEFINPQGSETLLDLYCGAGTIGIMLSRYVKKVIGVEIIPDAVASAQHNIKANNKEDCIEVHLEDVKTFCKRNENSKAPDVIIIDPPRCGIQNKVLKYILRIGSPKILYISCNPKTQFQECKDLIAGGYEIKKMQPIDQFPHSAHLENIILLEREVNL